MYDYQSKPKIYWCPHCRAPVIANQSIPLNTLCPVCGSKTSYLCSDLRPVFPEEMCMLELITPGLSLEGKAVWANDSIYYLDGCSLKLNFSKLDQLPSDHILQYVKEHKSKKYTAFNRHIAAFIEVNHQRLAAIKSEAIGFIRSVCKQYPGHPRAVSFSGGKDSTCVAHLARLATGDPFLPHVFGDTTLELPTTYEYVDRYRRDHPNLIFRVARNEDQTFMDLCAEIGPPARQMRWCCTTFKSGPSARVFQSMFGSREYITFLGLRRSESKTRENYERIQKTNGVRKIQNQLSVRPIIDWIDADVWLYLLTEKLDFNLAYRYGAKRVGCFCCPNSTSRSNTVIKILMPDQFQNWHQFIFEFACKIGRRNPENYWTSGNWRLRKGGTGLAASADVKIRSAGCTTEENATIYQLNKPVTDDFYNLFIPFGTVSKTLGRKLVGENIVLDQKSKMPILSIQPFGRSDYEHAVKIKLLNLSDHEKIRKKIEYQIRKFNACRSCLKCEAVCPSGAIHVSKGKYQIDASVCKHCGICMDTKHLPSGCIMNSYLYSSI